eukprot:scaffold7293_cov126-Isochrysis_galbana.AAC.3
MPPVLAGGFGINVANAQLLARCDVVAGDERDPASRIAARHEHVWRARVVKAAYNWRQEARDCEIGGRPQLEGIELRCAKQPGIPIERQKHLQRRTVGKACGIKGGAQRSVLRLDLRHGLRLHLGKAELERRPLTRHTAGFHLGEQAGKQLRNEQRKLPTV